MDINEIIELQVKKLEKQNSILWLRGWNDFLYQSIINRYQERNSKKVQKESCGTNHIRLYIP